MIWLIRHLLLRRTALQIFIRCAARPHPVFRLTRPAEPAYLSPTIAMPPSPYQAQIESAFMAAATSSFTSAAMAILLLPTATPEITFLRTHISIGHVFLLS